MCLILFAARAHAAFPLVVAANRDEAYARPAAAASFWEDQPHILAGRDLEHRGTWLGITLTGRWAAITNFRQGGTYVHDAPSRGNLVGDYLAGHDAPQDYLTGVAAHADRYNGFNLLAGDLTRIYYLSNRDGPLRQVDDGIHGLSNHLLDTPWPKVVNGRSVLASLATRDADTTIDALFAALADRRIADPATLPDTGIGLSREKALSPAFIAAESYGTRASTVVLVDRTGQVVFTERSFGPNGELRGEVRHVFALEHGARKRLVTA